MKTEIKKLKPNKIHIINDTNVDLNDDLREEYDLSTMDLKPNPYAGINGKIMVELSPDVAQYFKTSKQLNDYLRNQINLVNNIVI